ncbi:MAG: tRNA (adenosine(37)-N6)-threonylcarbamoyltransferase complex ATPase subunit type 1 TsaE [Thermodesulfobacteriota bacterium]|nr:tRNA (adenosine(37)-N6)-threonylcarbamoyltransferase complex ATPase subunit type 1 TsaE [Thermodesulfobacteriota bacterium]
MKVEITSTSDQTTRNLGEKTGRLISSKIAIGLAGDLGAGKTTFVKGMAKGLGVPDNYYITSPTYNIINEYPGRIKLCHMDLYRLSTSDELEDLGFDEIVESNAAIIIEWPGIIDKALICFDIDITIRTDKNFNRKISLIGSGLKAEKLLKKLLCV